MHPDRFRFFPTAGLFSVMCLSLAVVGCSGKPGSGDGEWTANHERLQTIADHGLAGEDDVPFALERLENGSVTERVLAAWALGEIEHAGAEPKLREALEDPDANVRSNVVGALIKLEPGDWVDILATGLSDRDSFVQQSTLSQLPEPTPLALVESISGLLNDSDDETVRIGAADALGAARGDGVAEALARGATDLAKDVRVHVAFALGKIEDSAAIPVLVTLLTDEQWEVRANAVQALGKYEDPGALEAVRGMLEDSSESVRTVAASIVGAG